MLKVKADWPTYLHKLRTREIEMVFRDCPADCFARGLELGAGDGFLSDLLARYARNLTVTDFFPRILSNQDTSHRIHKVCDAERVGDVFEAGQFDLVFSSNMLEHLPRLQQALSGIHKVLRDDGFSIHVMPSPFWKICQLMLFAPDAVLSRIDRYTKGQLPYWLRKDSSDSEIAEPATLPTAPLEDPTRLNNPKAERRYGYLHRLLLPLPHGVSTGHLQEYRAFQAERWRRDFQAAGFDVVAVIRGPVSSGFGFGLDWLRAVLEKIGLASEYAFVTVKSGQRIPHAAYFKDS